MATQTNLSFKYYFIFENGHKIVFEIELDPVTLKYIPKTSLKPSTWTKLENNKCQNCPLKEEDYPECPLALPLSTVIPKFSGFYSYENVQVIVETKERTYSRQTTIQSGLSAMLGIYMVTNDCPVMSKLRPMVRFHLPFASIEETVFRAVSTYLVGQYFRHKNGKEADWNLKNLLEAYNDIQLVNHGMSARLRSIAENDANINALVVLDIFAKELPFNIEKSLRSLRYIFEQEKTKKS